MNYNTIAADVRCKISVELNLVRQANSLVTTNLRGGVHISSFLKDLDCLLETVNYILNAWIPKVCNQKQQCIV